MVFFVQVLLLFFVSFRVTARIYGRAELFLLLYFLSCYTYCYFLLLHESHLKSICKKTKPQTAAELLAKPFMLDTASDMA